MYTINNNCKYFKKCFTTIELLLVISIVGILLASTMAVFNTARHQQGAMADVRSLSKAITLARSYAISHNCRVALIIPDKRITVGGDSYGSGIDATFTGPSGVTEDHLNQKYLFKSFGICTIGSDNRVRDWVTDIDFFKLSPAAIAFFPENHFSGHIERNIKFSTRDGEISINRAAAIIFNAQGGCEGTQEKMIRLYQGYYIPDGNKLDLTNKNNYRQIDINSFTGRAVYEKITN